MSNIVKLPEPERGGFNLSRWAIEHRSFTRFLLVLILIGGAFALFSMGQKEDPDFTFRVMVVQALLAGRDARRTCRTRSSTRSSASCRRRRASISSAPTPAPASPTSSSTSRARCAAARSSDAFYQVRKKIGDIRQTLAAGRAWGRSSTTSSATPTSRFTPSPATASPIPSSRHSPSMRATCCCACPASTRSI